jgi:hypothetical protein
MGEDSHSIFMLSPSNQGRRAYCCLRRMHKCCSVQALWDHQGYSILQLGVWVTLVIIVSSEACGVGCQQPGLVGQEGRHCSL